MKIDLDDVYYYPVNKSMALDHQKAVNATHNLGDYLDWGAQAKKCWNLQQHQKWINFQTKYPEPYSANAIYWRNQFAGMFIVTEGADRYSAQFLYWISGKFQGNGIATVIAEIFTDKIFAIRSFDSIEIHVDRMNFASQSVPKKLGYQIEDSYTMEKPMGNKGSGTLDVWVKYQPNLVKYRPELIKSKPRTFGWDHALLLEGKKISNAPIQELQF